ncbi:MAG: hypothetical protein RTV72_15240, partial [Candidatus Thorarchaeota archaeon]
MEKRTSLLSLEKLVALPFQTLATPSPDGQRIAFVSNMSGQRELHVIDINTREIVQLTKGEYRTTSMYKFNWTADGKSLIFPEDPTSGKEKFDLYKITYPDGKVTQLTDSPENLDAEGKQSPVSDTIAFLSDRSGSWQIHTMEGDGSNIRQLTKEAGNVLLFFSDFYWSPQGEEIVFTKTAVDSFQCYDVWVARLDGTNERKIISLAGGTQEILNYFSKDGSMILFTSDNSGTKQVGVYHTQSEEIKWISTTESPEEGVCITNDGKEAIVIRYVDAEEKLVVYDITTGEDSALKLPSGIASSKHTIIDGRHLLVEHQNSTNRSRYLMYNL